MSFADVDGFPPLSRYAACTRGVLERCARAVAAGADLDSVIPGVRAHQVAITARGVLDVLEAGDLDRQAPVPEGGGDWLRTLVAEAAFDRARRLRESGLADAAGAAYDDGLRAVDAATASADRHPFLFYEDIAFEAAQWRVDHGDRIGLDRQAVVVAEMLARGEDAADDVATALRDLAGFRVALGDVAEGVSLLARVHRSAPGDLWSFNAAATELAELGLPSLAALAAERGIELVRSRGLDRHLEAQLRTVLREAHTAKPREDVPAEVVADLKEALLRDFGAAPDELTPDEVLALVPDLARAGRKVLPPMPTEEALASMRARLDALLPPPAPPPRSRGLTPVTRGGPKVGRNDPCPCGSGKKFKKCCIDADRSRP